MDKRGNMWDEVKGWVIAAAILLIVVVAAFILREKLVSYVEYIINLVTR